MNSEAAKTKRPLLIILICVLGFLGTVDIFWIILYPSITSTLQHFGLGYTSYLAFSSLFLLGCSIGFWLMKKWAVYGYTAFTILNQVALLMMGQWTVFALILPAIILFVGYRYLSQMS